MVQFKYNFGAACYLVATSLCGFSSVHAAIDVSTNGVIQLTLPDVSRDARGVNYLGLELDGYDVSAFATLTGLDLSLNLSAPLDAGSHQLQVLAFYNNGDAEVIADETLQVQGGQSSSWNHAISLNNSYRSIGHEKADFAEVDHYQSNGAVAAQGQIENGNWQLSTEIETLYDSNENNNTSANEFDLSLYHLEARYQDAAHGGFVRVGDRLIEQENLLFSAYQRRGISSGLNSADGTYNLTVFGFQSDPTTSPDSHLAYPGQQQERSAGGVFTFSPLEDKQALQISAGYIDGEGTGSGAGFQALDENTIYGGDSWNTRIDSYLFNSALWLHGEYARSNFDSDGINQGVGEEGDEAWSAGVEYSSAYRDDHWLFDQWTLGYSAQEVGTQYWSMANLGLAGDVLREKIYYQANSGGLGLMMELTEENNNTDDEATKADLRSRFANMDVYYTPMSINSESGVWAVLGMPAFNAYAHIAKREQPRSDVYLSGVDIDDFTRDYSLGASFSKERWSWSLQHNQVYFDDSSIAVVQNGFTLYEPLSDSVNYLTTLMFSFTPSERVSFSPMLQWNILQEDATDNEYESTNFGFDSQFQIIPERWFFNLNYSFNQNDNRYEDNIGIDSRLRDQTWNMQSTWRALMAKGLSPGVDVYLKGSQGRQQDVTADNGEEIYQILVGFTLYWNKEGN